MTHGISSVPEVLCECMSYNLNYIAKCSHYKLAFHFIKHLIVLLMPCVTLASACIQLLENFHHQAFLFMPTGVHIIYLHLNQKLDEL